MTALWPVLLCVAIVSACGGGGGGGGGSSQSAGVGGTGVSTARGTVQGEVTGFGSIYINGQKFNTSSSTFIVDGDDSLSQDDLSVGMVVTLEVETSNGQYTGKAFKVIYDDEVQGPVVATPVDVSGSQKTFKIFGQTVTIDATDTVFKGTSFAGLDADDVIEVSGFRSSPTGISASYVKWKETLMNDSEVELRGTISGYLPPAQQFMLDGVQITFDNTTEIEVSGGMLVDGIYVEVEGRYQQADASVHAEEIEEEDEGFDDDIDDISLQGIISNYVDIADFEINGQQVDASQASLSPANAAALLANGVEVEVDGEIVGGVLIADELELREGDTRLKSFVSFVFADNKRFRINFTGLPGSIEVTTNSQTLFDDESPLELENFSVADMNVGDFVSVEGIETAEKLVAEVVKRLDPADPDDSELEGRVDSFIADISITVLGIAFGVNVSTQYEDSSGTVSSVVFFGSLGDGDPVEIKDEVSADGIAEEVKLDD